MLTRRNLITLVSGLLTLAVIAAIAFSLNIQPTKRAAKVTSTTTHTTYQVTVTTLPTTGTSQAISTPSSASTAAPTAGQSSGKPTTSSSGSSTGTFGTTTTYPTAGRVPPSTSNGNPTPTPSVGASPTATATTTPGSVATSTPTTTTANPTTTPAPLIDNSAVAGDFSTTTVNGVGGVQEVIFTFTNTGTSTWQGGWTYYLDCISNCLNGNKVPTLTVTPGNSQSFGPQLYMPSVFISNTTYSYWSMYHSGVQFGAIAKVKIVETTAQVLGVDPAPGCDSAGGMSWSLTGSTACANGGLTLTTNSAQPPLADLIGVPSGFNSASYYVSVWATFPTSTYDWVRLVAFNGGSHCSGAGIDVQPNGAYRMVTISNCSDVSGPWTQGHILGSNVEVSLHVWTGGCDLFINGGLAQGGGCIFTSGYPTISVGGNDGNTITVSNAELDNPVNPTTQWNVERP